MDGRVKVRVIVPAKIGGAWLKLGDEIEVTLDEGAELARAGVIALDGPAATEAAGHLVSQADFEAAVAQAAKTIAEAVVGAAVDQAVADLTKERDAALARATEAEGKVFAQAARIAELEGQMGGKASAVPAVPKVAKRKDAGDQSGS